MTPVWDSTARLKAANDKREHPERRKGCTFHRMVIVGGKAVWCARCGGIKTNGGEWMLPKRGGT